ncbi:hypothetical protein [Hyalangium minutum]|uniref:Uncharacterized protein n=1 Tax=Hyalangium minutum TaxID=394096 RepID=A0A085WKP6_9BACT|nr:hypothetical protein [Hyalangium minutum]KFE68259.1 hypothetical protein DB31_7496 [Hyalangium minutum]
MPTSGEIIGFLAKTMEWSFEPVKPRTWRNFTAGKRVSMETRQAVFRELAGMFVTAAPTADPEVHEALLAEAEHLFSSNADWWDGLVRLVASIPAADSARLTPQVALRLATSELAQRFAAVLALVRQPCPSEELPDWLQENAMRDTLRALLKGAGVTREALATACKVEKQAVDKWLDAPLPPDRRIKSIVNVSLKQLPPEARREVSDDLLRLRLKAKLAERLAARIGWPELKELGRAFFRLTRSALAALEQVSFASDEERARQLVEWLRMGSDAPIAQKIQPRVAAAERDRYWAQVAQLSSEAWFKRLMLAQRLPTALSRLREIINSKQVRHYNPAHLELMERILMRAPLAPEAVVDFLSGSYPGSDPDDGPRDAYEFYVQRFDDILKEPDRVVAVRRLERIIDLLPLCIEVRPDTRLRGDFERLACRYHCLRVLRLLEQYQDTQRPGASILLPTARSAVEQALQELSLALSALNAEQSQNSREDVQRARATLVALQQALEQGDTQTAVRLAGTLSLDTQEPRSTP